MALSAASFAVLSAVPPVTHPPQENPITASAMAPPTAPQAAGLSSDGTCMFLWFPNEGQCPSPAPSRGHTAKCSRPMGDRSVVRGGFSAAVRGVLDTADANDLRTRASYHEPEGIPLLFLLALPIAGSDEDRAVFLDLAAPVLVVCNLLKRRPMLRTSREIVARSRRRPFDRLERGVSHENAHQHGAVEHGKLHTSYGLMWRLRDGRKAHGACLFAVVMALRGASITRNLVLPTPANTRQIVVAQMNDAFDTRA